MKKNILTICFTAMFTSLFSQIGINTPNPQGILHIDGAKDNPPIGIPTVAEQANDFVITDIGNVGIGTNIPSAKLEINSGIPNVSGLRLTHLISSTPISAGTALGVDGSGNVVTVNTPSFTPSYGVAYPSISNVVNINAEQTIYDLTTFTLPIAGTYLITYVVRGEIRVTGGSGSLTAFLCSAPSVGNILPGSEVLIVSSADSNRQIIGATGTGSILISITAPKVFNLGIKASGINGTIFNDNTGYTHVSFVKITP